MKNTSLQIINILKEKEFLEQKLKNLLHGSIEIRTRANKRYIFVHFRENNKLVTKYAGEYSDYLHRLILENSEQAKQIKSQLRKINKTLIELGYIDSPLNESIDKCLNYMNSNVVDFIQCILFADKTPLLKDSIESTLNGEIKGLSSKDAMKIINLKNAIDFINNKYVISNKPTFANLMAINKFIEEGIIFSAGSLRTTPYTTNGRYEAPGIPVESVVRKEMEQILVDYIDPIDQAIESLLYIMKHKLFLFGNKRTALVYVNSILIYHGLGLLMIPTDKAEQYKKLYISYRDNDDSSIKEFIKKYCIIIL